MIFLQRNLLGFLQVSIMVFLGIGAGIFFPRITSSFAGMNAILSNLLAMCVTPIVVSTLIVEIVSFSRSSKPTYIKKFIGISAAISVVLALFAGLLSFIFSPGTHTTFQNDTKLSEKISASSIISRSLDEAVEKEDPQNFFDFFSRAVPKNVFDAFSHSKTFQIIVFTIVFSLALSFTPNSGNLEKFFQITRDAFSSIFSFVLKFLPILIFTSTALSVAAIGVQVFLDMVPFLVVLLIQLVIIFFVNLGILSLVFRQSFFSIIRQLETVFLVSFSGSVLAATLPTLEALQKLSHTKQPFIKIVTPISMFLNRFGNIIYFCFSCFFIGQVYDYHFTWTQVIGIVTFSMIGGIACAGAVEGIFGSFLLSILDPINIPATQVVLVLSSLDFLVAPFLSVITVETNIVVLSLIHLFDRKKT